MNQIPAIREADTKALELAIKVLRIEAQAVTGLIARLDGAFSSAVSIILACKGRVIVSGIGKSGHIARKTLPPSPAPARRPTSCMPPRQPTATSA